MNWCLFLCNSVTYSLLLDRWILEIGVFCWIRGNFACSKVFLIWNNLDTFLLIFAFLAAGLPSFLFLDFCFVAQAGPELNMLLMLDYTSIPSALAFHHLNAGMYQSAEVSSSTLILSKSLPSLLTSFQNILHSFVNSISNILFHFSSPLVFFGLLLEIYFII